MHKISLALDPNKNWFRQIKKKSSHNLLSSLSTCFWHRLNKYLSLYYLPIYHKRERNKNVQVLQEFVYVIVCYQGKQEYK